MNTLVRDFRDFFVSLKLTVVLLVLGMLLVFVATLDQVNLGIWAVQEKYFRSLFVLWRVGDIPVPVFPGGYTIGGMLLINLVAAHLYRFTFAWRKLGLILTHLGIILLLVGELLTGLLQQDYNMRITEGETRNYAESYQNVELAVADITDAKFDEVVAIPQGWLAEEATVQHPKLPFRIITRAYFPNATLIMRQNQPAAPNRPQATTGIGTRVDALPQPITYKQDERNTPAALVELVGAQGSVGTWLVSVQLPAPQRFEYEGRQYKIALRFERTYRPFSLTLLKFSHDVYPGTEIPKNFSSRVRLRSDDGAEDREVLIYMNNPLRYAGLTFYQSGYDGDKTTILQVVRNPGWLLPYVACILVALGLTVQFCHHLIGFATGRRGRRRVAPASAGAPPSAPPLTTYERLLPLAALAVSLFVVGRPLLPRAETTAFALEEFGRLPVLANGRFKPMDTVARSSLLQLQNRQEVRAPNVRDPLVAAPTEWLLDVAFRPEKADAYPTFVVDNPELLTLIGKTEESLKIEYTSTARRVLAAVGFIPGRHRRFSYREIEPHLAAIDAQARLASQVESALRNPFQKGVLQLYNSLMQYQHLRHMFVLPGAENFLTDLIRFQDEVVEGVKAVRARQAGETHDEALVTRMVEHGQKFSLMAQASTFLVIPPLPGDPDPTHWETTGAALLNTFASGQVNPAALAYAGLGQSWRQQQPERFNQILKLFRADLEKRYPPQLAKSDVEVRFNHAEPFYKSMSLYGFAFLVAIGSWLGWPRALGGAAFWMVAIAWIATTLGIGTRMWLEGRPPVTNLYSSALFVGWGSVALCLVLERVFRNGIGSAAGALIGFATLIIAHGLSLSGDTLEMMRAVLDSNFWLATHVVVVTLGYSATFLAGFLALIYVARGVFTRSLDQGTADSLSRMVYGIVCFATLFSFAGTVLGGIWADQSWGRFWGWDPKENGALIIVVWNAVILHARWGGLVRQRGLMALAIFGNIVTGWSWFGTNMLGVGLHSYGFTDAAFWVLLSFAASQLAFIAVAGLPLERWRSFRTVRIPTTPATV